MITLRPAAERGHANHGWLDTWHTFSFADYHDPAHMGFRTLRVINDDRVAPGRGFGTHGHRDMEIVTYVLEGALSHRDSMGTGSTLRPGDVQRMSAGTGVLHSEFNASSTDPLHLLQIWITPAQRNLDPGYEEKNYPEAERLNRLRPVASPDGREGSLTIHQDVVLYAGILETAKQVELALAPGRHAWVHVARGELRLNGQLLRAGDGAQVSNESRLTLAGGEKERAEVLVFDLP